MGLDIFHAEFLLVIIFKLMDFTHQVVILNLDYTPLF